MSTLTYATNARIREIEAVFLPELDKDDPLRPYFPIENDDTDTLVWEQQDVVKGVQQWRGLDGAPPRVAPLGVNQFVATPGYYGEHSLIQETEITKRRRVGEFGTPIDVTEPQVRRQKQLWIRRMQLIRKILWDLVSQGVYQVFDAKNTLVKAAGMTLRNYVAPFPWSNFAQSGPLADFTAIRFFGRGYSANFGSAALGIMNLTTFANMRQNTNAADMYGRRTQGLGTFNSEADIKTLLAGDGLPNILVYEGGYYDDAGVFRLFVPDNTVVVLAPRTTGSRIGAYRMTRNAANPGAAPGSYSWVVDRRALGQMPPTIEVHDGHNGGPIVEYPSSIAVMHV